MFARISRFSKIVKFQTPVTRLSFPVRHSSSLVSEEWNDLFRIRNTLSSDQENVLRSTEAFANDYLAKRLSRDYTDEITPSGAREVMLEFGKLGQQEVVFLLLKFVHW